MVYTERKRNHSFNKQQVDNEKGSDWIMKSDEQKGTDEMRAEYDLFLLVCVENTIKRIVRGI